MGTIREKITSEIKTAMKAKQAERLKTLRLIKAEIIKKETEKNATAMTEPDLMKMLQTMRKQREESIRQYEKGGRIDLADSERQEIKELERFLPKALSDEEVHKLVDAVLAENEITQVRDMGKAVKEVMARAAGGADGKRVSAVVRGKLVQT